MADKKLTSSRCRVSVGQHCKYNISLVILEVQTVLRSISKLLFWLLLSYWSSRNPLFLSNKKSWWRESNPWPPPYQGDALPTEPYQHSSTAYAIDKWYSNKSYPICQPDNLWFFHKKFIRLNITKSDFLFAQKKNSLSIGCSFRRRYFYYGV